MGYNSIDLNGFHIKQFSEHNKMLSLLPRETMLGEVEGRWWGSAPPPSAHAHLATALAPTRNKGHPQLVLGAPTGRWTTASESGDKNWPDSCLCLPMYLGSTGSSWEGKRQQLRVSSILASSAEGFNFGDEVETHRKLPSSSQIGM